MTIFLSILFGLLVGYFIGKLVAYSRQNKLLKIYKEIWELDQSTIESYKSSINKYSEICEKYGNIIESYRKILENRQDDSGDWWKN